MVGAIIKQVTARIIALFNPAGAILQALEAIYRVLKWIFQNAAKIFAFVETVVNGIADIVAGNTGGFAVAVEKALGDADRACHRVHRRLPEPRRPPVDRRREGQEHAGHGSSASSRRRWSGSSKRGKALLAAVGLGKKEKKEGETPHDQAVSEVAETLSKPPPGEPLEYAALRTAKVEEAATIVANSTTRLSRRRRSR